MKHRNPPRIATWLLTRLSNCDEALVGDMIEEYRRGRSRVWYWQQTSVTIFRATVADVRTHPVLAMRAVVVMLVCVFVYQYCAVPPLDVLARDVIWKINPELLYPEHFTYFSFGYSVLVIGGVAPCIGYLIGARIVARLHHPHQAAFTSLNAALVLIVNNAWAVIWFIAHHPDHLEWLRFYGFYSLPRFLLFAVSMLVGGLWKHDSTPALPT